MRLDKNYQVYLKTFKKHKVDGYELLNQVDDEKLIKYGINNEKHRAVILAGIKKLKRKCVMHRVMKNF